MAKAPGAYYPLYKEGSEDNPPPYSEVDPTAPEEVGTPPLGFITDQDSSLRARAPLNSAAPLPIPPVEDPSPSLTRVGVPLASKSIDVVCPHCQTSIRTSIEKRPGVLAYLSGAVMACLCCFCGCCLIPCCIDECMEVKHTCPNCDGLIGKYRL